MKNSLPIKIIGTLFFLLILMFASVFYIGFKGEKENLINSFIERAKATTYSLSSSIISREDFQNKNKLVSSIQKNMLLDSEIKDISFNVLEEGVLVTYVSSNKNYLNQKPSIENTTSLNNNIPINKISNIGTSEILEVITPLNIAGQKAGTIQIFFTLENINQIIKIEIARLIFIYLLTLVIFLFLIYIVLKFIIFRPILEIDKGVKAVSQNNFDYVIINKSNDEIGNLANAFNRMISIVKESRSQIEAKVKEQTIKINNKILESENQNKAILNILEDVEIEKNNAENMASDLKKFKLAVENASDQIVITDVEGIVIFGNKAVEKITGYKAEEALGKKAGILWKVPMPEGYYENMWDVIKNKKETFTSEIQNKRKNGDVYTAIISISSVLDKHGNIVYFVAIERDITKEKEVDRAKTEFVSLASHQLRTPLSAINWYTEMLLAGDAGIINDEQKQYLEEIAIGNKRMVDLVDDLLNVSRLDMGTFVMDTKSINVLDLLKSVINETKSTILEKKLIIHESYDETLSLFSGDEKLMRMIFQNLISNAVKYIQPSGIIKIYLSKLKKDDTFGDKVITEDSLAFCVSDTGIGIPIGQQSRIFSKLFRADNAKESETEGTGLGLYVVKSIVDKAGGLLWFKSEENVGSTFYVIFPIAGMKIKEAIIK